MHQNSIMVVKPYKWEGMWVFDDEKTGLVREPFVAGVPVIPSKKRAPISSIRRAPQPESPSSSCSPNLTQFRLVLCLVPRERAVIPDLLARFDRGGCSGG